MANHLSATLDGIVSSFTVNGFPAATAGTALAATAFTVTAKDADGNAILGTYENPVTLSDADASGATAISTSGSDSPPTSELLSSTDTAKISYTGLAMSGATITAASSGATSGTGTFKPTLNAITPSSLTGGIILNNATATPVSYTASEIGFTNSPYNKTLTMTLSSCSSVGTLSQTGNTFKVSLASVLFSGTCTLTLSDGLGETLVVPIGADVYYSTGAAQTFTVPSGITTVTISAFGAQGFEGSSNDTPGNGGSSTGTFAVTAGSSYGVYVGGNGGTGANSGTGGFNGGGNGCYNSSGSFPTFSGGGGGGSDVRSGSTRIIVAGGGGGAALGSSAGSGGAGGGLAGVAGTAAYNQPATYGGGGGGGTQSGGGAGGTSVSGPNGTAGSSGNGGAGAYSSTTNCTAGGGGGYYGGGGGGLYDGGGGGGSGYVSSSASNVSYTTGTSTSGAVWIYW